MITNNPLLQPFCTKYGTAPFSKIHNEHYVLAFEEALKEARVEMNAIIENPEIPSFENTIEAMDRMGYRLGIIENIFFNLNSAETNDQMQEIAQEIAPMLSEFSNDVSLNEKLFMRIKSVYQQINKLQLTAEQLTLLDNSYKGFVRNGANLSEDDKVKYREITNELSKIGLQFQQNVLAETNAFELHITNEKELAGLPNFVIEAAEITAKEKGKSGWVFTLHHTSFMPFMKYSECRELREKMFRASSCKGNQNNEFDNKKLIEKKLALTLEITKLLGYKSYADYVLEKRMAESVSTVNKFLQKLHLASKPHAEKELKEVQEFAKSLGFEDEIERWDWAFYSEKLKNNKFGFKEEELKPYFQLERVVDAVFELASNLYNIKFIESTEIERYHNDVRVFEVFDTNSNNFISVLYTDFFPRESKRSGAWMTNYQSQYIDNENNDHRPHISIVCNFTKPTEKRPSLLTFDELTTLLHEFGHALHGMLSKCKYASISGTNVYWDFVELPSQIHENWAYEKQWLDSFAKHYKTGEKIPENLINKVIEAKNFQAGYASERQLSFAMLDIAYYSQTENITKSISEFENDVMQSTNLLNTVDGALMSTSFSHIFAGGYASGYYSYKWAEVLDADAFSLFRENGVFDKKTADSFRINILEKGGSEHPMVLYKRFRGQEPSTEALLEREGLLSY